MAHKRIRKFNTKETYPEQKLDNDLSQAVIAKGTTVFLRGQVSQDLDTRETLNFGDPKLQTRKTMENIDMLLKESGSCMDHVCRIVVYLTDIRYREEVYKEMGLWLKGVFLLLFLAPQYFVHGHDLSVYTRPSACPQTC